MLSCRIERAARVNPTISRMSRHHPVQPLHEAMLSLAQRWSGEWEEAIVHEGTGAQSATYLMQRGAWYRLSAEPGGVRIVGGESDSTAQGMLVSSTSLSTQVDVLAAKMAHRWGSARPLLVHDWDGELGVIFEDIEDQDFTEEPLREVEKLWTTLGGKRTNFLACQLCDPGSNASLVPSHWYLSHEALELVSLLFADEAPYRIYNLLPFKIEEVCEVVAMV